LKYNFMKSIDVSSCGECPYIEWKPYVGMSGDGMVGRCRHNKTKAIHVNETTSKTIHPDCKLPNKL